jgi:nicotinic acid mononucleotide adenylyltransferase
MCELAITSTFPPDFPIKVLSTEIDAGCYIPTIYLMRKLRETFADCEFSVVIGSDLVETLPFWDLPVELLRENHFIIVPRCRNSGELVPVEPSTVEFNFTKLDMSAEGFFVGITNLSSTEVRHRLQGVGIYGAAGIVPLPVLDFIRNRRLYGC